MSGVRVPDRVLTEGQTHAALKTLFAGNVGVEEGRDT